MQLGNLEVILHRTVRVADGRVPSNLPPSLGRIKAYKVADYKAKCPKNWDADAVFVALHDTEALWLSFESLNGRPHAVMVGAGGINALTGEKLGTVLATDNYLVNPPQPWLDGWKSDDGSVYQFVATPYQKGSGKTVGEQIIKEQSKTGAIGLAVFETKNPATGRKNILRSRGISGSSGSLFSKSGGIYKSGGASIDWSANTMGFSDEPLGASIGDDEFEEGSISTSYSSDSTTYKSPSVNSLQSRPAMAARTRHMGRVGSSRRLEASVSFNELGIGKGGKIAQKIYPDPYGVNKWQDKPVGIAAIYVVDAETFRMITGITIPAPKSHAEYGGTWFGVQDGNYNDVAGTDKFDAVDSVFTGDTSNLAETPQQFATKKQKSGK